MTYLSVKPRQKKRYTYLLVLGAMLLVISIFWISVKRAMYNTVEPTLFVYGSAKHLLSFVPESVRTYVTSHRTLAMRVEQLTEEQELLRNELANKSAQVLELEGLLGYVHDTGTHEKVIVAYPLTGDITSLYKTIILSKGFKDGVTVDSIAFISGNQVVCRIKEVYTATARCELLTASDVITEGVTSSSSIVLTLSGRGSAYLANVPRDTPIEDHETVYLRSNPRFVIGEVKQVLHNDQDTAWHVFVEGAVNPRNASRLYVESR